MAASDFQRNHGSSQKEPIQDHALDAHVDRQKELYSSLVWYASLRLYKPMHSLMRTYLPTVLFV